MTFRLVWGLCLYEEVIFELGYECEELVMWEVQEEFLAEMTAQVKP